MGDVRLPLDLADRIRKAVYSGADPHSIADLADGYLLNLRIDYTAGNYQALRYYSKDAYVHPKKYLDRTGLEDVIRGEIKNEADRVESSEKGHIITAEFWMYWDFLQFDFYADVANIIAVSVGIASKNKRWSR